MSDNENIPPREERKQASQETWQEVGKQFQQLGESLAQTVRTAWNDEENRRRVQQMQSGLEAMVSQVGQAINETASSPQGQQIKEEAKRTAQTLVSAGEQTVQEIRPHLIDALKQLNEELQKMVDRMEARRQNQTGPEPPSQEPPQP